MSTTDINNVPLELFPVPSSPASPLIPRPWPGISPESTAALREVLQDNHTRWHIFFNDIGSNHSSHRAIANWALGASDDVIKAGYEYDCAHQRTALDAPEAITARNFKDHLEDGQYYRGYLAFFTGVIRQHGVAAVVEQYVFSKEANIDSDPAATMQPHFLSRFLGSLVHPMIHVGYGLEFGLPGMVAEGLAEAAVHAGPTSACIPDDFLNYRLEEAEKRTKDGATDCVKLKREAGDGAHVFTVLARILNDPALGTLQKFGNGGSVMYASTMKEHGAALIQHMADWRVDATDPRDVQRKIEELSWMNTLIYGVGGWSKAKPFNADFFHMHLVTSSIFLASYAAYLTPSSQAQLLRGYLLGSLTWWVSRGRPNLDIKGFYEATSPHPTSVGPPPSPSKGALLPSDPDKAATPNAWLPIVENAVVHPDDHVPKIQRALSHYSALYGSREAGQPDFNATELPGADKLDGSLFIRVAGLTASRMGRVREGEEPGPKGWDRSGFYKA
ncbi:putative protein of unknown function (DUF4243) [Lyophyllum shimeji]|uniref:Oxidoreductase AflY n=1 Tax=Lyophyllum shimeji TaxID=47721 RepID=A0A9P3PWA7_LYOSH|nr:putative protein of unknown function (DUF4243) [Lyophyllum shimeji]